MARVVLILGGNRGDVSRLPEEAIEQVSRGIGRVVQRSRCYESEPWGFQAEERFWNCVVEVESDLSPEEVLAEIHRIEARLGRDRVQEQREKEQSGERYTSRTMDIDILFYDQEVISTPSLQIPHPRLEEREFVLRPLCELMPERQHPISGRRMQSLLEELGVEHNDEKKR